MGGGSLYDRIGTTYTATRAEDPRIARAIVAALGDARTVLNVGAGTGSYEPRDRQVTAVEPSPVMIAHRAPGAAPAVRAAAEALPFEDAAFDAAMVVFSDHHWSDRERALGELARVTRDRVVLVNADPARAEEFWMTREYLPGFVRLIPERYRAPGAWTAEVEGLLGRLRLQSLPIPHDCRDGFYGAYWRRPEAYLDPRVRSGTSVFSLLPQPETDDALRQLRDDLDTGAWHARHARLLELDELDLGYFIVTAERTR